MKHSDNVTITVKIVKNECVGELLDEGVLGMYEQGAKGITITAMSDPAVVAHELGHFLESLFGIPASCSLAEHLEDTTRAVWREYSHSESGHKQ